MHQSPRKATCVLASVTGSWPTWQVLLDRAARDGPTFIPAPSLHCITVNVVGCSPCHARFGWMAHPASSFVPHAMMMGLHVPCRRSTGACWRKRINDMGTKWNRLPRAIAAAFRAVALHHHPPHHHHRQRQPATCASGCCGDEVNCGTVQCLLALCCCMHHGLDSKIVDMPMLCIATAASCLCMRKEPWQRGEARVGAVILEATSRLLLFGP